MMMRIINKAVTVLFVAFATGFSPLIFADTETQSSLPTPQLLQTDGLKSSDLTPLEAPWPAETRAMIRRINWYCNFGAKQKSQACTFQRKSEKEPANALAVR